MEENATMRRLENYVRKYGPEFGPVLYHALQSQAAHAGVSARLRRKIDVLTGKAPAPAKKSPRRESLPLFPESDVTVENAMPAAIGA
jgi:hypothetical protein